MPLVLLLNVLDADSPVTLAYKPDLRNFSALNSKDLVQTQHQDPSNSHKRVNYVERANCTGLSYLRFIINSLNTRQAHFTKDHSTFDGYHFRKL